MSSHVALAIAVSACGLAVAGPAAAQPLGGSAAAVEAVRLIDGWQETDGSRMAAIEIRLRPGWHTYWRVPGEAGIPLEVDWSGSENLAGVAYRWPRPALFERFGLTSFGHDGTLVLPVVMIPEDRAAPIEARGALAFGVCEDICAPAEAEVAARLAPDDAPSGRATIAAALATVPMTAVEAGVTAASCRLGAGPDGPAILAEVSFAAAPPPMARAVFETGGAPVALGRSVTRGRVLSVEAPLAAGAALDRRRLRLTLVGDGAAVEIPGCAG